MKKCSKCREEKEQTLFNKDSSNSDGLHIYCKACRKEINKKYIEANSDRVRAGQIRYDTSEKGKKARKVLRTSDKHREKIRKSAREAGYFKKYGITPEDYGRMFAEQEGQCSICNTHQSQLRSALAVDHCHKTGQVRGLLCNRCNMGIGYLKDSPEIIANAIKYLKGDQPEREQDYLWLP